MEIAGVDYPERPERFEVNYHLLSLTENHRIRAQGHDRRGDRRCRASPSLWPVAGWLEREVFDMYGVGFAGNPDLRRILTDYGFEGHPLRKDFPLTGYVELRYSEAEKRVVYEPVSLPQDFRTFDFLMPWEGAEYRLPGDEKADAAGARRAVAGAGADGPRRGQCRRPGRRPQDHRNARGHRRRRPGQCRRRSSEARKPAAAKADNAGGKASTDRASPSRGKKQ